MNPPASLQIEMVKLVDGTRVLRVTDAATATTLERRVDPAQPVVRQKEMVAHALRAVLDRELKSAAAV
jgi:hypothetical protein